MRKRLVNYEGSAQRTMKTRLAYLAFLILAAMFLGFIIGTNVAG